MDKQEAQQHLMMTIAFSDRGASTDGIEEAFRAGADLNAIDEDGRTPLTEAVLGGMGSPKAVEELLRLGADPNLEDRNGWTPWTANRMMLGDESPVVKEVQERIQGLLEAHDASHAGEEILALAGHVLAGDLDEVRRLLEAGVPVNPQNLCLLTHAIGGSLEMARALIEAGAQIEGSPGRENQTPLMNAAQNGELGFVKLLIEAGADANLTLEDCWTPMDYAVQNEHEEVVQWLREHASGSADGGVLHVPTGEGRFDDLGVLTKDMIATLERWDAAYGIEAEVGAGSLLLVNFKTLPADVSPLAAEIYEFCPDVVDQNFGCMDVMVEMMEASGQPLSEEIAALIKGVDFSDDDFGHVLLRRSLEHTRSVGLWWD